MRTLSYAIKAAVAAGVITLTVLYLRSRDENAALRASASRVAKLEAQVNAMQRDVGGLGVIAKSTIASLEQPREVPMAAGAALPAASGDRRQEPATPEELQLLLEEGRKQGIERLAQLNRRIQTEPRDPTWARNAESQLTTAFAAIERTGSRLNKVDCRSKVCRVEITHDSESDQDALVNMPPPGLDELPYSSYVRDASQSGKVVTLAFMGREPF